MGFKGTHTLQKGIIFGRMPAVKFNEILKARQCFKMMAVIRESHSKVFFSEIILKSNW